MMIISYLYRQLCKEVQFNIAYRWFCKVSITDKVPDRLGVNVFKEIFINIILQCKKVGLIKGERVMTDGTLFQANASLDSMIPLNKRTDHNDLKRKKLVTGIPPPEGKKITNKTHISKTDSDASLAFKKGAIRSLKYKNHLTIDADSRVILDTQITTGSNH